MKKIPSIFERDWDGDRSRVVDKINPAAQWVFDGEGWATRKIDGSCCCIKNGVFLKRREVKKGKVIPDGFIIEEQDLLTGKTMGSVFVGDGNEDKYFKEAYEALPHKLEGTYELLGPKVQGNLERRNSHELVMHSDAQLAFEDQPPRDFEGLKAWLEGKDIEGIVWHNEDGRCAKIKLCDFGLVRP